MESFLDPKTQLLVALGAAVAAKCQNCFATLYRTADKVGASDEEMRAALAIARKVTEKSHDFMAAFVAQTSNGTLASAGEGTGAPGGCGCS